MFPRWLQKKFNLWNKRIHFVNETTIRYRDLLVPACKSCNSVALSQIEDKIQRALAGGASEIRALGHQVLFVWLAKIMFGTLYAEALLPTDRAQPAGAMIVPEQFVTELKHLHFWMQAARTNIEFVSDETSYHSSIMVFNLQRHPEIEWRFSYRDELRFGAIALRLDTVGIICVFDGGAQERLAQETFPKLFEHSLHPLQFEELTAKVIAKASTFQRTPFYVTSFGPNGIRSYQAPMNGLMPQPLFGEWDQMWYAQILAELTGHPLEYITPDGVMVTTWIGDYDDPRHIDVHTSPWP
ncbi:hypothetical protein BLA39750_00130 [Burkholderia lata]|uniref:Uncharacterized protein n=1 Tax=Burkholderia lata (strain ATCC 17760 / DSM 23089 / LMG 22485 / NCIMB 9086 / R18194 / 383) TaxID=482957 RepID=A0A6P2TZF9_BURL3|nr:hypothetical protein [Burkholderia lata]VWC65464.1 hypothetical protein BLA39750_00130 [Burkholderia lata]